MLKNMLVIAGVAGILLFAGCGGSAKSNEKETTPMTEKKDIAREVKNHAPIEPKNKIDSSNKDIAKEIPSSKQVDIANKNK